MIKNVRHLHKDRKEIPEIYKSKSLHIALEEADNREDWITFKKLYNLAPEFLDRHLKMLGEVIPFNYTKLSAKEIYELFN